MKDPMKALEDARRMCKYGVETCTSKEGRDGWFYTHIGEIEMLYELGLIEAVDAVAMENDWTNECRPLLRREAAANA